MGAGPVSQSDKRIGWLPNPQAAVEGGDFECATRLYVVEVAKCSRFSTNGFVAEVAVLGGVNC